MTPAPLDTILSRIGETQTLLPAPVALIVGILVFVVMLGPMLWKITIHAETVVHESAHALVGLATGRRIRGVTINQNGGGATDMVPKSGFGYGVGHSFLFVQKSSLPFCLISICSC